VGPRNHLDDTSSGAGLCQKPPEPMVLYSPGRRARVVHDTDTSAPSSLDRKNPSEPGEGLPSPTLTCRISFAPVFKRISVGGR